jgi:parallel beta-helix repeat protein
MMQSTSSGIYATSSDHLTINNNVVKGGMYGITLHTTRDSQLNNNTVTEASYGIYLAYSNYNTIGGTRCNTVAENDWGIFLYSSTSNQITNGNAIGANTWGMYITSGSGGNTIHHNNFVDNVVQAFQALGYINTWDDGVEGNYWNDYSGYPPANGVDYHPLPAPWPLRNIATTIVTVSTTPANPGDIITNNATVKNFGVITETFTVTAYFNSTLIGTQTATLTSGSTTKLTYKWNTTNVQPGYYVISVTAGPILYVESNYADNSISNGPVGITFLGDCDVDGDVDYEDFVVLAAAYGSTSGQPAYNPVADLNDDGHVNYSDFVVFAADYGRHL